MFSYLNMVYCAKTPWSIVQHVLFVLFIVRITPHGAFSANPLRLITTVAAFYAAFYSLELVIGFLWLIFPDLFGLLLGVSILLRTFILSDVWF